MKPFSPLCDLPTGYIHDVSFDIRRTTQMNSLPTEIIMYSKLCSKMAICVGDEFDSYESTNQTTYESHG